MNPTTCTPSPTMTRVFVDVRITQLYRDALYGKQLGVRLDQGRQAWVRMPLYSQNTGAPVVLDVGNYATPPTVEVRLSEATGVDPRLFCLDVPAEIDADGKSLIFLPPCEVLDHAGIYRTQARVLDSTGAELLRDELMVMIDRGFWGIDARSRPGDQGPPTLAEVRTSLRDHPVANRLLGDYEFDTCEIAYGIVSAIQSFNQGFPPLPSQYNFTTRTFPRAWRRQLLSGATSYILEVASSYYRRGNLPYTAGGLSINDLAKDKEYQSTVNEMRAQYLQWVKTARASINIRSGFGSIGSGYPWGSTY